MFNKTIVFLFIFINFAIGTYGQNDSSFNITREVLNENDVINSENINQIEVITASRSKKKIEDLPMIVYVVTRQEIIENGYITLVDVLKSVPGIRVSQPGCGEYGDMFLMRGLLGNAYAKILVNNIPIQPTGLSAMPIGAQLPIRDAERIEIIYGAASSMYGVDAVVGVINIITKEALDKTFASADILTGQNGYNYLHFLVGGKTGKNKNILKYSFYGSNLQYDNLDLYTEKDNLYNPLSYFAQNGDSIQFMNDKFPILAVNEQLLAQYNIADSLFLNSILPPSYAGSLTKPDWADIPESSQMFGIKTKYRGWNFSYDYMHRKSHSSIGQNTYLYRYNDPYASFGETVYRTTGSYEKTWRYLVSTTNLSFLRMRSDKNSYATVTYIPYMPKAYQYRASDDFLVEQFCTLFPAKSIEIVGGLTYQYSGNLPTTNYSSTPFDKKLYRSYSTKKYEVDSVLGNFGFNPIVFHDNGSFFQINYTRKKLLFIWGTRYDNNSLYGKTKNPRYSFLYKRSSHNLFRVTYGISQKAPAACTSYYSIAYSTPFGIDYAVIPNPDLKPEKCKSFEMGYRHVYRFLKNAWLDLSIYQNVVTDPIVSQFVTLDTTKYLNSAGMHDYKTRMYKNVEGAKSRVIGTQLFFASKDMHPKFRISTEIIANAAFGLEILSTENDSLLLVTDTIKAFRQLPNFMLQWNLSFYPFKNIYLNFENVYVTSWYRKYITNIEMFNQDYSKIPGYYALDASVNLKINNNFRIFCKVNNVFNRIYGGLDATGMDIDLRYNPQLKRNFRFGLTFNH